MKVYALVGKSGTGKSYQAMGLCKDKSIESIIDDGLYIYNNNVVGGRSAKREPTKVGAVKTALFTSDEHRDQVVQLIKDTEPESILLIGTSDGMVSRINKRLKLPPIDETIYITDITSEGERQIAYSQRMHHGKHVIPAPIFQLKRQFSGYFMDPLQILRDWGFTKDTVGEKSVVRPTYSYMGDFIISDRVISQIIEYTAATIEGISETNKIIVGNRTEVLVVTIVASFKANCKVYEEAKRLQRKCREMLETMTAFHIEQVNVEVKALV